MISPHQRILVLIVSFFAKFIVEEETRAVFFGWVTGFFFYSDFTVFAKVFSLFYLLYFIYRASLGGFSVFTEDYLSLFELSFTFRAFS